MHHLSVEEKKEKFGWPIIMVHRYQTILHIIIMILLIIYVQWTGIPCQPTSYTIILHLKLSYNGESPVINFS